MCGRAFEAFKKNRGALKCRDHCHITGAYRGAAHGSCNLRFNFDNNSYRVPVIFHNLKNYDAHFLIKDIYKQFDGKDDDFSVLATNNEKFISF